MGERARLPLPEPYGPLNVAIGVEPATGVTRYRFRAPRAHGLLVLRPSVLWDTKEVIPSGVRVQLGDGRENEWDTLRTDRPVVNGVDLCGAPAFEPVEYLARPTPQFSLRRPIDRYNSRRAPDTTNRYLSAIIRAVVEHWHARPDLDQLRRAAGRHTAGRRLWDLEHQHQGMMAIIAGHEKDLAATMPLIDALRALAAEHDQHQPPTG